MKQRSVRRRIVSTFGLAVAVILTVSLSILGNAMWLSRRVAVQFRTELYLGQVDDCLGAVGRALESYLLTRSQVDLSTLRAEIRQLESAYVYDARSPAERTQLMLDSVRSLLVSYETQVDGVVDAKLLGFRTGDTALVESAEQTAQHIRNYADRILLENLVLRADQYRHFSNIFARLQLLNLVMIASAIGLAMLLLAYLTRQFSEPLARLSHQAVEIAGGRLEQPDLQVSTDDEIGVTARAFDLMKKSIRDLVEQLKAAAQLEKTLSEQRLRNLRMQTLLRAAEMESLRSQMDPHFLFNTLNTGVQLAVVEDADRTADFMSRLAELFRHNVRRNWQSNEVADEIAGIELYRALIDVRFPNLYRIEMSLPDEILRLHIPPLVFQPLVENSIIHGFADRESGGKVKITGAEDGSFAVIRITDDGCGIPRDVVKEVLAPGNVETDFVTPHARLGLRNVVLRLRLFSEDDEVIDIARPDHGGTNPIEAIGSPPWQPCSLWTMNSRSWTVYATLSNGSDRNSASWAQQTPEWRRLRSLDKHDRTLRLSMCGCRESAGSTLSNRSSRSCRQPSGFLRPPMRDSTLPSARCALVCLTTL
jgi:two-component system sensor histidine kinase YesM